MKTEQGNEKINKLFQHYTNCEIKEQNDTNRGKDKQIVSVKTTL